MDEHRLAELFHDAVRDAPPASFDERDVATASRKAAARRRSMLAGGTATLAVALLAGLVVAVLGLVHTGDRGASAGVAQGARVPPVVSSERVFGTPLQAPNAQPGFPGSPSMQGGGGTGGTGPGAGSASLRCGPTDRELAVALANELPSVGGPNNATPADLNCPSGSRAAAYPVHDGTRSGVVEVVLLPANQAKASPGAPADAAIGLARAKSGAWVLVVSEPRQGSAGPPFVGRVSTIAQNLAPKF